MAINNVVGNNMFISYRRETGIDIAARVKDYFSAKGFNVFYDIDSIKLGEFDKQIIQHINESNYFVLILSPNALDRCINEDDWVRIEIECALKNANIKIIPLILQQFKFPNNLPDSLNKIKVCHGIDYNAVLFELVMDKLFNLISNNNPSIMQNEKELIALLNELYTITLEFRNALRNGMQNKITTSVSNLGICMQSIYDFYEKCSYIEPKLSELALSICNQFNAFVPLYNEFANSIDRMSSASQKTAHLAEDEFNKFVSLILKSLNELKK